MGGPIGLGIFEAIRKARARRGAGGERQAGPEPWAVFLLVTVSLSWLTAALVGGRPQLEGHSVGMQLLRAAAYYAAVMGWQPLVGAYLARRLAGRRAANGGLHRPRALDVVIALGLAVALVAVAMLTAWALGEGAPTGGRESGLAADDWTPAIGALIVLLAQAATEEYGWRGYPLAAALRRFGPDLGLVIHGVAWGAWYAPLFVLPSDDPRAAVSAAGGFIVTCLLLGVVLAWLRLRSRSIVPPVIANAVITLAAGLPMFLHTGSESARDAVLRWPGWPVLGAAALLLLVWRRRDLAAVPAAPGD